jgi:glycine oxidase
MGFDPRVTAGGVYELLRDARELVPGITELELAETTTGFRPGTPDNLPIIGPAGPPGVLAATGHGRNGVLLSPITADAVAAFLTGDEVPPVARFCDPGRFSQ